MCLDTRLTKMTVALAAIFGARTARTAHSDPPTGSQDSALGATGEASARQFGLILRPSSGSGSAESEPGSSESRPAGATAIAADKIISGDTEEPGALEAPPLLGSIFSDDQIVELMPPPTMPNSRPGQAMPNFEGPCNHITNQMLAKIRKPGKPVPVPVPVPHVDAVPKRNQTKSRLKQTAEEFARDHDPAAKESDKSWQDLKDFYAARAKKVRESKYPRRLPTPQQNLANIRWEAKSNWDQGVLATALPMDKRNSKLSSCFDVYFSPDGGKCEKMLFRGWHVSGQWGLRYIWRISEYNHGDTVTTDYFTIMHAKDKNANKEMAETQIIRLYNVKDPDSTRDVHINKAVNQENYQRFRNFCKNYKPSVLHSWKEDAKVLS